MITYTLKNSVDGEVWEATLFEILREINDDRNEEWEPYDETDWKDGLLNFTTWEIV
jgi:hypothetical protein